MKTWLSAITAGLMVLAVTFRVEAGSFNNKIAVQGYLKSGSTGLTGTYDVQVIVRKNGSAVWYKTYSGVSVTSGIFSKILSGNDDAGSPVPMAPDVFVHSANSDNFTVDVKVDVDQNGLGVGADATFTGIDLVPVPLSLYANRASTIDQSGATSGQYLMWNGSAWAPTTLAVSSTQINSGAVGSSQLSAGAVDLSTSTVTGVLPVANGGTGISTTPANGKLLIGNGTGYTSANITAGSGVTVTNSAGGITIAATGTGGTVTDVSSANSDIGVATGTSTPVLTLNSGTGASQILKLNGTAQIPAVDGSLLTSVNAAALSGTNLSISSLASGQFLKYNGTNWVNSTDTLGGLSCSSGDLASWNGSAWACNTPNTLNSNNTLVKRNGSGVSEFSGVALANGTTNVTMSAAAAGATYGLTWPSNLPGSNGMILSSTTGGTLSWVSAPDTGPQFLRMHRVLANATAVANLTNIGFQTAPTVTCATPAAGVTNNAPGLSCLSTAVSGQINGWGMLSATAADVVRIGHNPDLSTAITTAASIASQRIWVGFGSTVNFTACGTGAVVCNTLAAGASAFHVAGIRYVAGTDTNFMCQTCDGTNCGTPTDSGVAVAANTYYTMRVQLTSTAANFYINGTLVCTKTTNLPGAATSLGAMVQSATTAATASLGFKFHGVSLNSR